MKLHFLVLLSFFCVISAQEKEIYRLSTDLNPVAQMSAALQAEYTEYKKCLMQKEKEQDLSPSPVLDTNAQAYVLAVQQKEAEKIEQSSNIICSK